MVLVGSNIGIRAIPDSAAYCVAKAGLHMLAQVLALEWAPRSIRCNAIAPGPVHTAMVEARLAASQDPGGDLARLSGVNPLQRLGSEEEIAALAAHLLSDESCLDHRHRHPSRWRSHGGLLGEPTRLLRLDVI